MKHFLIVFAFSIIFTSLASAQDLDGSANGVEPSKSFITPNSFSFESDTETIESKTNDTSNQNRFSTDEPDVTIIEDKYAGQYFTPSVQNLSKLYWNKNTLDLNNDIAVDNFLKINECNLYTDFYNDDFEWTRIRDAARKMLSTSKSSFPDKFKFLLPVELGRYDLEKKGFPLENDTAFIDLRRVEMGGGDNSEDICGSKYTIDFYPRNIVLALSSPFSFDFLPVDEHIAQAFLIRRKYDDFKVDNALRLQGFDRIAYARLRVHLTSYQGQARGKENTMLAVMFGKIEGIDFFEDPYETKLLKSIDFE